MYINQMLLHQTLRKIRFQYRQKINLKRLRLKKIHNYINLQQNDMNHTHFKTTYVNFVNQHGICAALLLSAQRHKRSVCLAFVCVWYERKYESSCCLLNVTNCTLQCKKDHNIPKLSFKES